MTPERPGMTAEQDAELRRLAEKATPGPWRQTGTPEKSHWFVTSDTAQVHGTFPPSSEDYVPETIERWTADAAYIAAANPQTIIGLLDNLAVLRAERDRLRDALDEWKCPACGGAGTYQQKGEATGYEHVTVLCRKCDGSGLHPIARAALEPSVDNATQRNDTDADG